MKSKIEDLRVSCGIDTLYYYCDIDLMDYTLIYDEMSKNIELSIFKYGNLHFLGTSSGYHWFLLKDNNCSIARIGFKSYSKQRHIKDIFVQLDGSSIYFHGLENTIDLVSKELKFIGIPPKEKYVSRIDLNIFCNVSFAELDTNWIATRSKTESQIFTILNGKKIETVYFGKRANGKVLRIYNKIEEIKKNMLLEKNIILVNKLKKDELITDDLDNSKVWNIELELHRKFLKKQYKIDTLDDMFNNLYSIWEDEMQRFKILLKSKKDEKNLKSKKNRIPELPIWLELKKSYTYGKILCVGSREKSIPYIMKKNALFQQTVKLLNKYNSYQNNPSDVMDLQSYTEELINYLDSVELHNDEAYNEDDYKYIPITKYDKNGLIENLEYRKKQFYEVKEND